MQVPLPIREAAQECIMFGDASLMKYAGYEIDCRKKNLFVLKIRIFVLGISIDGAIPILEAVR